MRLLPLVMLALLMSCATYNRPVTAFNTKAVEAELMQADRDYAVAVNSRGLEGWMSYLTADALRIKYRGGMVKGLTEIRKLDAPIFSDPNEVLEWEPTEAHVFESGRLGITTGTSVVVTRGPAATRKTLYRGHYVTLWRREPAGWRVIMDTGYPDPAKEP